MIGIRSADYILAAVGIVGHAIVLLLLVRRHLLRQLPFFALLIAFYLLRAGLFLMPRFLAVRPGIYWLLIYLDSALQLLLILVSGLWACRRSKKVALAIPVFLSLAVLLGWLVGPSSHFSPQNLALKLSIVVSALWLQAAVALFLIVRKRDLQTIRLPLGIAYGFAAYSAMNIVTQVVHMHYALLRQPALYATLSYLRVAVYLCCLATWSFLLWSSPSSVRQDIYQTETAGR
jgi:hypothetical protein